LQNQSLFPNVVVLFEFHAGGFSLGFLQTSLVSIVLGLFVVFSCLIFLRLGVASLLLEFWCCCVCLSPVLMRLVEQGSSLSKRFFFLPLFAENRDLFPAVSFSSAWFAVFRVNGFTSFE